MFPAMREGLFRAVGKDLKNIATVAINQKRPDEIYTTSQDGTLYASTDGGTTWTERR